MLALLSALPDFVCSQFMVHFNATDTFCAGIVLWKEETATRYGEVVEQYMANSGLRTGDILHIHVDTQKKARVKFIGTRQGEPTFIVRRSLRMSRIKRKMRRSKCRLVFAWYAHDTDCTQVTAMTNMLSVRSTSIRAAIQSWDSRVRERAFFFFGLVWLVFLFAGIE